MRYCTDCGQDHRHQKEDYPVGAKLLLTVTIEADEHRPALPVGTIGIVTDHCSDGRASTKFLGQVHTFHYPTSAFVRVADDVLVDTSMHLTQAGCDLLEQHGYSADAGLVGLIQKYTTLWLLKLDIDERLQRSFLAAAALHNDIHSMRQQLESVK